MKTIRTSFLLLILCFLTISCVTEEDEPVSSLSVGDRCPAFTVKMNDGATVSTPDLAGRQSIIVFFNTSCSDCRKEFPEIQKLYDRILSESLPVNLLCIAREESEESISRYWEANGLTLPYSPQPDRAVYSLFASSVIPRIYIISPELVITAQWDDSDLPSASEILQLLSAPKQRD